MNYRKRSEEIFSISEQTEQTTMKSELDYYKDLCKEFKNITFRLEDKQTAMSGGNQMGYGGSMNQVGSGFGNFGQCSISIDVGVIRRMLSDPEYERRVKGIIDSSRCNYKNYEQAALEDGFSYVCVNLEDEDGKVVRSKTQASSPFSTEDEVRKLWADDKLSEKMVRKFDAMENELLDTFLSFTESRIKSEKFYDNSKRKS
jgi:hypothetical protein